VAIVTSACCTSLVTGALAVILLLLDPIAWPGAHAAPQGFSPANLNALIRKAPAGSRITLPPGIYESGIKIGKPLDVDMAGVRIANVYGGKALVVVEAGSGPVTIRNFRVNGKETNATRSNLAAFRVSGRSFDVTIDNAHVTDTALGLMSGNRGGRLHIRNSFFSDIGSGKRKGLSHIVYAGSIDELTVENTVLQRSLRLGHLLKSRAKQTTVRNSRLLGLDGHHSRVIDVSCGGRLDVRNSVLQVSSNADNSDLIAIGVETEANCKRGLLPGDVTLVGNTIVFDRGLRDEDTDTRKRQNRFFTWKTAVEQLRMVDNVVVSPGGDYVFEEAPGGMLRDFNAQNEVFLSRRRGDLSPAVDTDPTGISL